LSKNINIKRRKNRNKKPISFLVAQVIRVININAIANMANEMTHSSALYEKRCIPIKRIINTIIIFFFTIFLE